MRKLLPLVLLAILPIGIPLCSGAADTTSPGPAAPKNLPNASPDANKHFAAAQLSAKSNSHVEGTIQFYAENDGVRVVGIVTGLTAGAHGFHVHDKGDCSAPDASSAGGHFNPGQKPHGGPSSTEHHAGDLGNITADDSGRVEINVFSHDLSLTGANSIVGKSVVIHASADDMKTNPAGNSGARIACGVISEVVNK